MDFDKNNGMESSIGKLGCSLKVPSVQELSKQKLSNVPPRYVRPHHDPPFLNASSPKEIPTINMHKLLSGDGLRNAELEKLDFACKDWGFFQLINHGVSSSVLDKMKKEMEEFFHLPEEEKEKLGQAADEIEGFGQAFVVSEEQKLDWADMFYMVTLPAHMRNPNLLSKLPVSFREAVEIYAMELNNVALNILSLMAKALGMRAEDMILRFGEGSQSMRMNHYPPCPEPDCVLGFSPHSDSTAITILLQVSEVEGLQVKKDGVWVPVVPHPDALIVNIGDMMEIVTNGIYKSIEHRATLRSDEERISVAAFFIPELDCEIGPAPCLINPENPAKFKQIRTTDYIKGYLSRELKEKSYLDLMKV